MQYQINPELVQFLYGVVWSGEGPNGQALTEQHEQFMDLMASNDPTPAEPAELQVREQTRYVAMHLIAAAQQLLGEG